MKRIVFTVTNDLTYDQRMERICSTLALHGFHVTLIGREHEGSIPLTEKPHNQRRISCLFQKGKLFYIEYNLKLLWHLLFIRCDIICSIDLDSILPGYIVSVARDKELVYDAHEYFTEMEEIVSRPMIKRLWLSLERFILKRIQFAYTISDGYAELFRKNYGKQFEVIRNVPRLIPTNATKQSNDRIVQYQGILNIGRGLEEAIKAVCSLDGFVLRIFGDGPHGRFLKNLAKAENAGSKVQFMGMVEPGELRQKTNEAWVGLTLFSKKGLHHQHSLANRFFDYMHAGIPQIAIGYPEYEAFNQKHEIALLIPELTAMAVRVSLLKLSESSDYYERLKNNCPVASAENNWDIESKKLIAFYERL